MLAARWLSQAFVELTFVLVAHFAGTFPFLPARGEAEARKLLGDVEDPGVREKLTPRYRLGCKRPSFSNEYVRIFNRENVHLATAAIEEITPEGVRTSDGVLHPIDVLVLATGYKVFEKGNMPPFPVSGVGGVELAEFWDANRQQAYEGVSVPGFPNWFTITGPYGFNGQSYFGLIETQMRHIVRCLKRARSEHATRVEITPEANQRYFECRLKVVRPSRRKNEFSASHISVEITSRIVRARSRRGRRRRRRGGLIGVQRQSSATSPGRARVSGSVGLLLASAGGLAPIVASTPSQLSAIAALRPARPRHRRERRRRGCGQCARRGSGRGPARTAPGRSGPASSGSAVAVAAGPGCARCRRSGRRAGAGAVQAASVPGAGRPARRRRAPRCPWSPALRGVDDHRALPQRDPGQPAGNDPDLLAEDRERPQVDVPRGQPAVADLGRRGGEVDQLLGDEPLRVVLDHPRLDLGARPALACGPMNTPLPPGLRRRLDDQLLQAAEHVLCAAARRCSRYVGTFSRIGSSLR